MIRLRAPQAALLILTLAFAAIAEPNINGTHSFSTGIHGHGVFSSYTIVHP